MVSFRQSIVIRGAVVVLFLAVASSPATQENPAGASITAFVNVNIVAMDHERILRNHAVLIEGRKIAKIFPMETFELPRGTRVIDGEGSYLMPGLADMHAHLNTDSSPNFMALFLAQGVTTVRNLNAMPEHLKWRDEVARGERPGPTIYTSGPVIVGPPDEILVWTFRAWVVGGFLAAGALLWITLWLSRRLRGDKEKARRMRKTILPGAVLLTMLAAVLLWAKVIPINAYTALSFPYAYFPDSEQQARAEVRRQDEAGYDLIKVYDYLTRGEYLAVIEEARSQGIYVIGHLDHGIEEPLAAGLREIAHVDELLDEHLLGEISPRAFEPVPFDYERIPQTVASVVEHDVFVVSNMVTDVITYEYLEAGPNYFERPEYEIIRPQRIEEWRGGRMVNWQGQQEWRRNSLQPFLMRMIAELNAAGVPILTGTDTGVQGSLPVHIHRELELLVDAGFTPYEALSAATRNARRSVNRMGVDVAFGEIAVDQRADLILVAGNPLQDVSHTRNRIGVMAGGNWYPQQELDRMVADFVATFY